MIILHYNIRNYNDDDYNDGPYRKTFDTKIQMQQWLKEQQDHPYLYINIINDDFVDEWR